MNDMFFEEFRNTIVKIVKETMPVTVEKNMLVSPTIKKDGKATCSASVDLFELYDRYNAGESVERIAQDVIEMFMKMRPGIALTGILSTKNMRIIAALVPKDFLDRHPDAIHDDFLDLAVVYRRILIDNDEFKGSLLVSQDYLDAAGITKDEMMKYVDNSTECCPLTGALDECRGKDADISDVPVLTQGAYVIRRKGDACGLNWLGAGPAMLSGIIPKIAEANDCNVIILPSSIHEVLIMPDYGTTDYDRLASLVSHVNSTEVAPDDRLSDHVYGYDIEKKEFVIRV